MLSTSAAERASQAGQRFCRVLARPQPLSLSCSFSSFPAAFSPHADMHLAMIEALNPKPCAMLILFAAAFSPHADLDLAAAEQIEALKRIC